MYCRTSDWRLKFLTGSLVYCVSGNLPKNTVIANGAEKKKSTYKQLLKVIGSSLISYTAWTKRQGLYGNSKSDPNNKFRLPNLINTSIRVNGGVDPYKTAVGGQKLEPEFGKHIHVIKSGFNRRDDGKNEKGSDDPKDPEGSLRTSTYTGSVPRPKSTFAIPKICI